MTPLDAKEIAIIPSIFNPDDVYAVDVGQARSLFAVPRLNEVSWSEEPFSVMDALKASIKKMHEDLALPMVLTPPPLIPMAIFEPELSEEEKKARGNGHA